MRRPKLCLAVALSMATVLSAFALISSMWASTTSLDRFGVSLGAIIASYYAAALIGGGLVGVILQAPDSLLVRAAAGLSGAFALFFCIGIARNGWISSWTGSNWATLVVLALVFGVGLPMTMRRDFRT
jgi:hypothetical protein